MAQPIVPLLEEVDVDEDETKRVFGATGAFAFACHRFLEIAMVVKLGEAICNRELFENEVHVRQLSVLRDEFLVRGFDFAPVVFEFARIAPEAAANVVKCFGQQTDFVGRGFCGVDFDSAFTSREPLSSIRERA